MIKTRIRRRLGVAYLLLSSGQSIHCHRRKAEGRRKKAEGKRFKGLPDANGSEAPDFSYEKRKNMHFETRSARNAASLLKPLTLVMGISFCPLPSSFCLAALGGFTVRTEALEDLISQKCLLVLFVGNGWAKRWIY